ncbi:PrsW family intramembrane metalloprotease [Enterococcus hulanensis]|uniref:PrsW family glutamic-type intramembrane protease n=1 Tax=Enterococcus TaxID=1350 RepID=UPI000B5A7CD7|nr:MULTISPECIES: PrsW family glutamic-type intramembrane protease [Enterococcus]MBO0412398.1 PrsW family intramembrane metalloprotease [Enterococcus hulanensis]OTO20621.1 hypothetical protein A5875_001974 [Enterococcus sp. 3H8_DIV0648]
MLQTLSGMLITNTPGIAILLVLLKEAHRESVPKKALVWLLLIGTSLIIPITLVQTGIGLAEKIPLLTAHPLISELLMTIIRLAFVEELFKFLGTKLVTWKGNYFTSSYQGMLFTAIVGLCFGLIESLLFITLVSQQNTSNFWMTVMIRSLIGMPAHGAYGLIIGKFYGQAKLADIQNNKSRRNKLFCLAVFVPSILHGLYDWLVSSQIVTIASSPNLIPSIMIGLDILLVVFAYYLLYHEKKLGR